jgi:hypothetical protein
MASLAACHLLGRGCRGAVDTGRPRRRQHAEDDQQRGQRASPTNHPLHCLPPFAGLSTCSERQTDPQRPMCSGRRGRRIEGDERVRRRVEVAASPPVALVVRDGRERWQLVSGSQRRANRAERSNAAAGISKADEGNRQRIVSSPTYLPMLNVLEIGAANKTVCARDLLLS